MKFAKIVFFAAGAWGLVVLTPLFFLLGYAGREYPPAITHPEYYFGFLTVALSWQLVFIVIARDPARFRLLMIPAMVEKFGFVGALVALYVQGQLGAVQLAVGVPDFLLGLLFVVSFFRTRHRLCWD